MMQIPEQYPCVIEDVDVPMMIIDDAMSRVNHTTDLYVTDITDDTLSGFIFHQGKMRFLDCNVTDGHFSTLSNAHLSRPVTINDWDCSESAMQQSFQEMDRAVAKLRQLAQEMADCAILLADGEEVDFTGIAQNKASFSVGTYDKHKDAIILCRRINHAKSVWVGQEIEHQFYISGGWEIPVS